MNTNPRLPSELVARRVMLLLVLAPLVLVAVIVLLSSLDSVGR